MKVINKKNQLEPVKIKIQISPIDNNDTDHKENSTEDVHKLLA